MKHKEMSIETLRGIAIILMVAGHVIGHKDAAGMKVEDDSVFRYFYYSLQYLRMPLFTVISGYVYSLRPFLPETNILKFLKGKARRLLIPFVSVSTIQYILRALIPGINNSVDITDIWKIYIFGFDQFWFLQSIFLVFITIVIIENYKLLDSFSSWRLVLIVAIAARIFIPIMDLNIFSLYGYFQLLPFFILGCGLKRYSLYIFELRRIYFVSFIVAFILIQIQWFHPFIENKVLLRSIILTVGFSGIILLFKHRFNQAFLAILGHYAFSIYLFHVFGTVASRLFFEHMLPGSSPVLIFGFSLFFGLFVPIYLDLSFSKYNFTSKVFIGTYNNAKHSLPEKTEKAA